LLVHIFIGSRLALLVEEGEKMSFGDKAINYLSMIIGGTAGIVVSVLIYNRTMARAKELALEELDSGGNGGSGNGRVGEYEDVEAGLLDPEAAAAMMDDDDISLWDQDYDDAYEDQDSGVVDSNGDKAANGGQTH